MLFGNEEKYYEINTQYLENNDKKNGIGKTDFIFNTF